MCLVWWCCRNTLPKLRTRVKIIFQKLLGFSNGRIFPQVSFRWNANSITVSCHWRKKILSWKKIPVLSSPLTTVRKKWCFYHHYFDGFFFFFFHKKKWLPLRKTSSHVFILLLASPFVLSSWLHLVVVITSAYRSPCSGEVGAPRPGVEPNKTVSDAKIWLVRRIIYCTILANPLNHT